MIMRYLADVTTIAVQTDKCTGCGRCLEVCPHAVLRMNAEKRIEIAERDRCMECGACVANCAFDALSVKAGVGCAAALINSMITGGEPTCGCDSVGTSSTGGCC